MVFNGFRRSIRVHVHVRDDCRQFAVVKFWPFKSIDIHRVWFLHPSDKDDSREAWNTKAKWKCHLSFQAGLRRSRMKKDKI